MREISETVNISVGRVWHILHECLGMRKLSVRWVPRFLTAWSMDSCGCVWARLSMFQRNSKEFLRRYVTIDVTWIHHYMLETKNQSKMWTGPEESAPKKAKTVLSAGKVMATIFWDSRGIILIDHLQKGKCITGEYYASLLDRFDAILNEKRLHLAKKSAIPSRQCTSSHEYHCNGQIIWFTLRKDRKSVV